MTGLVLTELFKLRKRWMPYIMLGIMVLFLALLHFAPYAHYKTLENRTTGSPGQAQELRQEHDRLVFPGGLRDSFTAAQAIGSILMVVLAASVVGAEYAWGTVRTNLILGMGRQRYIFAKLILLLLVALALLLVVLVVAIIFNLITTLLVGGSIDWGALGGKFVLRLAAMIGRTWGVLAVPTLLASMASVLGRSSALGLGIGIAYAIVEPIVAGLFSLIQGWGDQVMRYTINFNTSAVIAYNSLTGQPAEPGGMFGSNISSLPDFWAALGILAGYGVFFLCVMLYLFRKRDIMATS